MPFVESEFAASQRDPRLMAELADHATGVAPVVAVERRWVAHNVG